MAEVTTHPPAPLEWHPAYRDKTWLLDWLNGKAGPHDTIVLPKFEGISARYAAEADDPIAPALPTYTLTRRRCAGPAPYVGRPFVYHWWAAVDEFGRGIAADSTQQYNPDDDFRDWGTPPALLPEFVQPETATVACAICADTGIDYLGRPCRRCSP